MVCNRGAICLNGYHNITGISEGNVIITRHRWSNHSGGLLDCDFMAIQAIAYDVRKRCRTTLTTSLKPLAKVLAIVQKNYVRAVSTKRLITARSPGCSPRSIRQRLSDAGFVSDSKSKRAAVSAASASKSPSDGSLTVVSPIERYACVRGRTQAGDQIIKINDDFTKDMSLNRSGQAMRGPKGSKIKLLLHRKDCRTFQGNDGART